MGSTKVCVRELGVFARTDGVRSSCARASKGSKASRPKGNACEVRLSNLPIDGFSPIGGFVV